ncbi:NAD(P)-dependent oxidoreductase [Streptomyces sp. NPDC002276]
MSNHVVVALGPVDTDTVGPVPVEGATFVTDSTAEGLAVAEGAVVRADRRADAELLRRAPRLRTIARTGVGVDMVDVTAASARGIPVAITPKSGSRAVAEGVLAMARHLTERLAPLTGLVRDGRRAARSTVPVGDLDGATLGMVTRAYDPFGPPPAELSVVDLDELAATSDVLTPHAPHAPHVEETRHLGDERLLARVGPGAILINCGRGGPLGPDATLAALESGRPAGAGLDVFDPEPALHHPLFDHPDVVLTPHPMGRTRRATTLTFVDAARGVADVLAGRPPAAVANSDWNLRKATA